MSSPHLSFNIGFVSSLLFWSLFSHCHKSLQLVEKHKLAITPNPICTFHWSSWGGCLIFGVPRMHSSTQTKNYTRKRLDFTGFHHFLVEYSWRCRDPSPWETRGTQLIVTRGTCYQPDHHYPDSPISRTIIIRIPLRICMV